MSSPIPEQGVSLLGFAKALCPDEVAAREGSLAALARMAMARPKVRDFIRSDLELFAGGFTAVDAEYDEHLGEVLREAHDSKPEVINERAIADASLRTVSRAISAEAAAVRCEVWRNGARVPVSIFRDVEAGAALIERELLMEEGGTSPACIVRASKGALSDAIPAAGGKGGNTPLNDDAIVAAVVADVAERRAKSVHDATKARLAQIGGSGANTSKIERIRRKVAKAKKN